MNSLIRITMKFSPEGKCITSVDEMQRQLAEQMFIWRTCPLPFVDVDDDELVIELGVKKSRIGVDYIRQYTMDTTFNVIKASIMRAERVKSKSRLLFRDLSPLLKMPVEIFLEVIEYLHPLDLYHLSTICNTMNGIIQKHSTVWATTWEAHSIPPCPPGFLYPQWADLLFGPAICDVCRRYTALPDFVHLKRYCTSCMLFWCQWGELEDPLLRPLVPASKRQDGWALPMPAAPGGRWGREMQHVQDTKEQLDKIQDSLDHGEEGAEAAYTDFINNTKEEADAVVRHAEECDLWVFNLFYNMMKDTCNRQSIALEKFKRRLLASSEGFKPSDFESFEQEFQFLWLDCAIPNLKRRSFKRCLPYLLDVARGCRKTRLIAEHKDLCERRRQSLLAAYNAYLQTLSPRLWRTYPPAEVFWTMDTCRAVIYNEGYEELGERDGKEVVKRMEREGVFREWFGNVKREVEASLHRVHPDGQQEASEDAEDASKLEKMKLATSVFSCTACQEHYSSYDSSHTGLVMFGWDEVKDHLHCAHIRAHHVEHHPGGPGLPSPSVSSTKEETASPDSSDISTDANPDSNPQVNVTPFIPTRIGYNKSASDAVKTILKRLDLPADKTTVEELDKLDKRFIFEERWEAVLPHAEGREVLTWRECVITVLQRQARPGLARGPVINSSASSNTKLALVSEMDISWTVLTPSEAKFVKDAQVQRDNPCVLDNAWSCAHCGHFLNKPSTQAVVVQHLEIQHDINQPDMKQDVVYLPSEERTPRQRILLSPLRPFPYSNWTAAVIPGGYTQDLFKQYHIGPSIIEKIHALVCPTHPKFTGKPWTGASGISPWSTIKDMSDVVASLIYWVEVKQGLPPRSNPYLRLEDDPEDLVLAEAKVISWSSGNRFWVTVRWDVLWKSLVLWCGWADGERRLRRYYGRVMVQRDWCLSRRQAEEIAEALMLDHSRDHWQPPFGGDGYVSQWYWRVLSWIWVAVKKIVFFFGLAAMGALTTWIYLAFS